MNTKTDLRSKLEKLQLLVVDKYIQALEEDEIHVRDFAPVITLLNHNNVVVKAEASESQHSKVKKYVKNEQPKK